MERKNGKFVGKENVPFSPEEYKKIERMAQVLSSLFADAYALCDENIDTKPFVVTKDDQSVLVTVPLPVYKNRNKVQRKGCPTYFIENGAYMAMSFRNQVSESGEIQADCFLTFHRIWVRGYRCRNKYTYSPNPHFDYGYSVDTIWEDMIAVCMKILWSDFGYYAFEMKCGKLDDYGL
jgi:hypothetical protein